MAVLLQLLKHPNRIRERKCNWMIKYLVKTRFEHFFLTRNCIKLLTILFYVMNASVTQPCIINSFCTTTSASLASCNLIDVLVLEDKICELRFRQKMEKKFFHNITNTKAEYRCTVHAAMCTSCTAVFLFLLSMVF